MCSAQTSTAHQPTGLSGGPPWRVVAAKALPSYRLELEFRDGMRGVVELSALIEAADAGALAALRDESMFRSVFIEHGAPAWPGEIDLAPDALYATVKDGAPLGGTA